MKDTLNGALRKCAGQLLEQQHSVTPDEIVECARRTYPSVFAIETERLVLAAARRQAKALMGDQSTDDQHQPKLPGILFPTAIAIPDGDEYRYVRCDKATLAELEAGKIIRIRNVEAAIAKLDAFNASFETLRPYFDEDHLTVIDAYRAWRQAEGSAA